jgi:hypothetical protein
MIGRVLKTTGIMIASSIQDGGDTAIVNVSSNNTSGM